LTEQADHDLVADHLDELEGVRAEEEHDERPEVDEPSNDETTTDVTPSRHPRAHEASPNLEVASDVDFGLGVEVEEEVFEDDSEAAGSDPEPVYASPQSWPGVSDAADLELLDWFWWRSQAVVSKFLMELRTPDSDSIRRRWVWEASKKLREALISLLDVENPNAVAECTKCSSRGCSESGSPCRECGATGLVVVG
jgi:hypothetical protein